MFNPKVRKSLLKDLNFLTTLSDEVFIAPHVSSGGYKNYLKIRKSDRLFMRENRSRKWTWVSPRDFKILLTK